MEDDDPDQHLLLEQELKVKEMQKICVSVRFTLETGIEEFPLTSSLHNLGDLNMQGRVSIWRHSSAKNMYLAIVKVRCTSIAIQHACENPLSVAF